MGAFGFGAALLTACARRYAEHRVVIVSSTLSYGRSDRTGRSFISMRRKSIRSGCAVGTG